MASLARVNLFRKFVFHSLVMMLNFVCYSSGNKHSGSQFELHTHSCLVVVKRKRDLTATWDAGFAKI